MGETSERVPLTASSPRDRAIRAARPLVAALLAIAAVVVAAVLVLPQGPVLTAVMVLALVGVVGVPLDFRRFSASRKPLEGTPPTLIAGACFGMLLAAGVAGRHLASLFLGPESVSETLPWSGLTATFGAAFMTWAMRPIKPKPPQADNKPSS